MRPKMLGRRLRAAALDAAPLCVAASGAIAWPLELAGSEGRPRRGQAQLAHALGRAMLSRQRVRLGRTLPRPTPPAW